MQDIVNLYYQIAFGHDRLIQGIRIKKIPDGNDCIRRETAN